MDIWLFLLWLILHPLHNSLSQSLKLFIESLFLTVIFLLHSAQFTFGLSKSRCPSDFLGIITFFLITLTLCVGFLSLCLSPHSLHNGV